MPNAATLEETLAIRRALDTMHQPPGSAPPRPARQTPPTPPASSRPYDWAEDPFVIGSIALIILVVIGVAGWWLVGWLYAWIAGLSNAAIMPGVVASAGVGLTAIGARRARNARSLRAGGTWWIAAGICFGLATFVMSWTSTSGPMQQTQQQQSRLSLKDVCYMPLKVLGGVRYCQLSTNVNWHTLRINDLIIPEGTCPSGRMRKSLLNETPVLRCD